MATSKPFTEDVGTLDKDNDDPESTIRKPGDDEETPLDLDRIEESVRGDKGLGIARDDRGTDRSETEDALRRATDRSKIEHGQDD